MHYYSSSKATKGQDVYRSKKSSIKSYITTNWAISIDFCIKRKLCAGFFPFSVTRLIVLIYRCPVIPRDDIPLLPNTKVQGWKKPQRREVIDEFDSRVIPFLRMGINIIDGELRVLHKTKLWGAPVQWRSGKRNSRCEGKFPLLCAHVRFPGVKEHTLLKEMRASIGAFMRGETVGPLKYKNYKKGECDTSGGTCLQLVSLFIISLFSLPPLSLSLSSRK